VVAGASAAVLIGLLFVALSINREATAAPHLGGQARQTIYALVSVFILSLVVLIPDPSNSASARELIAGALLNLVITMPRQMRRMRTTVPSKRMSYALTVSVYDGTLLLILAEGTLCPAFPAPSRSMRPQQRPGR
jgi:hypothetical protein